MMWETIPLRQLITPVSTRNRANLPLLSVVRDKGVIMRKLDKSDNHNIIPEDLSNYKVVLSGQFVINKMKAWQGSCGVSLYDGIVSPAYYVFDLNIDNPHFFNYAIRSRHFVDEFGRVSKGIRVDQWDLPINELKNIPFPFPPHSEQDQIVRYLDWKVSGINRLINTKKKQIELLKEQKRAIISETISKTNSETIRLKNIADVFIGLTYSPSNLTDEALGIAVLRANNIQNGKLLWEGMAYVNCAVPEKLLLRKDDILVCSRNGSRSLIGKCGKVTSDFVGKTFGAFNTVVRSEHSDYLYYIFHSQFFSNQAGEFSTSTINQLTLGMFNAMAFPFPSKTEQQAIVAYLDEQCNKIDKIVTKITTEISLLHEYRTRLISDVVTGKKDVSGVVIPEYESAEETTENEVTDETEQEDE